MRSTPDPSPRPRPRGPARPRRRRGHRFAPGPGASTLAATVLLTGVLATAPPAAGQEARDTADAADGPDATVLDGVYTAAQAERGQATFSARCAGCHAPGFFQAGTFLRAWAGRPVRSLFRRLRQTMPEDNPGGLRAREYAAVIAYILELNGYPAGSEALPDDEEALRGILMVEREEGGG